MILIAKRFTTHRSSQVAIVTGSRRDGTPTARFDVVDRRAGEIFHAPPEAARDLLAEGSVVEARLTGKLAALAKVTHSAESPIAAALAGFGVSGLRTWHAILGDGSHWQPGPASIGPTRSGFDAFFGSDSEIVAHWSAAEASTPLFSFIVEAGFRRAFIWRNGALLEIATQVTRF